MQAYISPPGQIAQLIEDCSCVQVILHGCNNQPLMWNVHVLVDYAEEASPLRVRWFCDLLPQLSEVTVISPCYPP